MHLLLVHGNYSSWSTFSPCSSSCGSGTKTRTRFCNNPVPDYGGRDCSSLGPLFENEMCNEKPCPVAGGYTQWSNFSRCSFSCGGGTRYRTRNCTNPIPQHGGDNCSSVGKSLNVKECNTKACPVNGNYSSWSAFGPCSTWCGNGQQVRNRSCTEPEPQYGGRDCSTLGLAYEVKNCNSRPCPVDGGYSEWSSFTSCSASCGYATKTRNRTCTNPEPSCGGNNCSVHGPRTETVLCNKTPCPVHGNYSGWSNFSPCDKTCGNGSKIRRRYCTNPEPRFGGRQCSSLGSVAESASCNQFQCPVHGYFSEWSPFLECTSTCGNSTRMRTRNCTNPTPMHGGNNCSSLGPRVQVISCDVSPCPVDGNYSTWSEFSRCSKTCGTGSQSRNRTCTNPTPRFGGRNCKIRGPNNETRACFQWPCPIHGNYTQWSQFAVCSATCGPGIKTRQRFCSNPSPKFGGDKCLKFGSATEAFSCNVRPCPVHGNYSAWARFGPCSKSCENGTQVRRRHCARPLPQYGGWNCSTLGPSVERRWCEVQACPGI